MTDASATASTGWHEIQVMFVDDPRSAVETAAGLVDDSSQALAADPAATALAALSHLPPGPLAVDRVGAEVDHRRLAQPYRWQDRADHGPGRGHAGTEQITVQAEAMLAVAAVPVSRDCGHVIAPMLGSALR